MDLGWVKLHRSLIDWEWYSDINTTRLFVHLLLTANHKDNNWRGITIKRGSRLTSLDKLSTETSLSVSKIRTSIKKLILTNEIASESHTQHTVFIIKNYDDYQGSDKQNDKPVTNESQTNDKPIATNKNVKKDNNEKKVTSRFTPPSFDEVRLYCQERENNILANEFIDHYAANGWMRGKNKIKDWKACVRTWEKNSSAPKVVTTPEPRKFKPMPMPGDET